MRFGSLAGLALRNISESAFRSWLIAFCALLIAGLVLADRPRLARRAGQPHAGQPAAGAAPAHTLLDQLSPNELAREPGLPFAAS